MEDTTVTTPQKEKISFGEKFSYSLGSLACNLVWGSIGSFYVLFYTDYALLPAATMGVLILLSRIFDGFSDIGMGMIVDRTKSPKGKARIWLLRMAIPFGIATVLTYTTNMNWSVNGRLIFAILTYNLMTTVIYTSVDMPYGVLNSTLSRDAGDRSVLNVFRLFMAIVAGIVMNFTVLRMVRYFGDDVRAWRVTFTIFGVIATLLFFLTYFFTKERVNTGAARKENIPFKTAFSALLKNKYWAMMVLFAVISYTSTSLGSASTIFYCRDILGNADLIGTFSIIGVVPMVVGTFIITPMVKKWGKRKTVMIGLFVGIIGSIVMAIAGANLAIIAVALFFRGIGGAFVIGNLFAMIADTIEYGEWKTGVRTEGLVYSASSLGGKIGNGLGIAVWGLANAASGYIAGAAEQSESALQVTRFMYLYAPIFLLTICIVILFFYKLDKEYPGIMADLNARGSAAGAQ